MSLDNPLALALVLLMLLMLVGAGAAASISIIFAYVPSAREWAKAHIDRLLGRR